MFFKCPFCKSDNITGGSWDAEAGSCSQEASCDDCHKNWYECYTACGYAEMHHPLPKSNDDAALKAWISLKCDHDDVCALYYPSTQYLVIYTCSESLEDELNGRQDDTPYCEIHTSDGLTDITIRKFEVINDDD